MRLLTAVLILHLGLLLPGRTDIIIKEVKPGKSSGDRPIIKEIKAKETAAADIVVEEAKPTEADSSDGNPPAPGPTKDEKSSKPFRDPAAEAYEGIYTADEITLWLQHKAGESFEGCLLESESGDLLEVEATMNFTELSGTFKTKQGKKFPLSLKRTEAGNFSLNVGTEQPFLLSRTLFPVYEGLLWEAESHSLSLERVESEGQVAYRGTLGQGAESFEVTLAPIQGILSGKININGDWRLFRLLPTNSDVLRAEGGGIAAEFRGKQDMPPCWEHSSSAMAGIYSDAASTCYFYYLGKRRFGGFFFESADGLLREMEGTAQGRVLSGKVFALGKEQEFTLEEISRHNFNLTVGSNKPIRLGLTETIDLAQTCWKGSRCSLQISNKKNTQDLVGLFTDWRVAPSGNNKNTTVTTIEVSLGYSQGIWSGLAEVAGDPTPFRIVPLDGKRILAIAGSNPTIMHHCSMLEDEPSQPKPGERWTVEVNGVAFAFRWCPAGSFTMGSPPDEWGHSAKVEAQIDVELTQGFWMAETETTQFQWKAMFDSNPSEHRGDRHPVDSISWDQAKEFVVKVSNSGELPPGWKMTLPTEAQWEYACRAGEEGPFSGGDKSGQYENSQCHQVGWNDLSSQGHERGSHPVAQKTPNPWHIYDMHGNVEEWCADWYAEKLAGGTDPEGPPNGKHRSLRGGCFAGDSSDTRSAARNYGGSRGKETDYDYFIGFRSMLIRE